MFLNNDDNISLFIAGDVINQFNEQQFVGKGLIEDIKRCDYAICNLEGVLSPQEKPQSMQQMPSTINSLKEAGFNLLLLANNHIADYGPEALRRTIESIKKNNLDYIGAGFTIEETYKYFIAEIKNKKFAFINICEAQSGQFETERQHYGYAWLGHHLIDSMIHEAKLNADYVIVFPHAGLEHYQLPLQHYRDLYRHYCETGADCVIASHPHITQGVEKYGNSLIAYSLGNFYFPRKSDADRFSDKENNAFSLILQFSTNGISYSPIYHGIENQIVEKCQPIESTDVEYLSSLLEEPKYKELLTKQNKEAFNKTILNLYRIIFNGYDDNISLLSKFKFFIRHIFVKESEAQRKSKLKILKHINYNETYRFLTEETLNENCIIGNHDS